MCELAWWRWLLFLPQYVPITKHPAQVYLIYLADRVDRSQTSPGWATEHLVNVHPFAIRVKATMTSEEKGPRLPIQFRGKEGETKERTWKRNELPAEKDPAIVGSMLRRLLRPA